MKRERHPDARDTTSFTVHGNWITKSSLSGERSLATRKDLIGQKKSGRYWRIYFARVSTSIDPRTRTERRGSVEKRRRAQGPPLSKSRRNPDLRPFESGGWAKDGLDGWTAIKARCLHRGGLPRGISSYWLRSAVALRRKAFGRGLRPIRQRRNPSPAREQCPPIDARRCARTLFRFMEVSEAECLWTGWIDSLPSPSLSRHRLPAGCRHWLVDLLDKVVKTIKRHQSGREIQTEVQRKVLRRQGRVDASPSRGALDSVD